MIKIPVEPPITEYLHAKAAKLHMPLNGSFELTPLCNMNCRMCYVRMSRQQQEAVSPLRTAVEWLQLGAEAKSQGMVYLLLTGGEPFSRPDFREIMQGLHRMGFVLSVNSNGTLIQKETVEWLKETPPVRINITIYGSSDETYGRLCGNPYGFTQATKAIRLLKEAGINVKLNCSITPYNKEDIEGIIAYAQKEGLLIQTASYMFPPLRRDSSKIGWNERLTPEEAASYSARVEVLLNGEEKFLERMKIESFEGLSLEKEDDCMETEGEGILCRAGKCSFWITWDGRLLPCGMFPWEDAGNVFQIGFARAWEKAGEYVQTIRMPGQCRECSLKKICRSCAAMAFTETGNYWKVPEYRCQMARAYPDACRRLEKEIREKRKRGGTDETV